MTWLPASSLITEEDIQAQVDKLMEMSEEELDISLSLMAKSFGKTRYNAEIFLAFLARKYGVPRKPIS